MKKKMIYASVLRRTRLSISHGIICALPVLAAPLGLMAQQTVFYDTFANSTINGGPTTNMIPEGTPTDSYTSYEIGSAKNATATTISSEHFRLITSHTTSGNSEAQALFTKFPVTLAHIGDYIELDYTFTDATNVLNYLCGNNVGLYCGLFDSGGVPPHSGTLLWNGGFSSQTTADTGGTKDWLGYNAGMLRGLTGPYSWSISSRPAQTTQNNGNQQLLYGAQGGSTEYSPSPGVFPFPNLTIGAQYTVQFRITLSDVGTLTVSNAMYEGVGVGGTVVFSNVATYTGANVLTTNFDGLAVGYRAGASSGPGWTNDINSITVVADLADQAGPYFTVTSSGNPCSGGVSVGLDGSVTTNDYLLYYDNTYSGQTLAGTGSALDFGVQSAPGTYTVIASNIVDGGVGPMYGTAEVYAPGVTINTQPASATVVSNLPVSFSVTATGASLSYQWYKNGVALTNNSNISGAQTPTLQIAAARTADAAATANGYTVVAQTPCGDVATSTPPAALTLTAPRNLIWAGGNPGSDWNLTDTNFTLSGTPVAFGEGDNATFNDSSSYQSVTISTDLISSFITVTGTKSYTFNGPGKITGMSQLTDNSSGTLIIATNNDYTGGTIINSGATLQLGDGSSTYGFVPGIVTVSAGGTLQYLYAGAATANAPINLQNGFAGSGTVNCQDVNGSILATDPTIVSSNFNGTINVQGYSALHASDNNAGYALGNGSTVNVPANTQVWLDRSATSYNNTFNIAGTGWLGATPQTGAMRVYDCTINGPINLQADARIGGSINGATIQSVISGPYQLEVWGNAGSFVLVIGPTNGAPQAYASTLITSGSIRAANTNAISTGPLTMDVAGDLQLNGNDLTVANLSSINSGQVTGSGPTVRNLSGSTSATLTVGTDNSSTTFGGTFLDGGSASLGLTKVGSGTLTLTTVSSNTGPVTVSGGTIALSGSGAFTQAPIVIGSSGTFDVSGAGGTLTLNAGQSLAGDGTLNGTLAAPAGSMVNPGLPTGTLTVSGSATINGTYLANLNRTNAINCSQLTASGGLTISGATLVVTNVGPKLQAGDVFQLFPGATSGFAAYNLQTNDVANNAVYTWNNTVASNGRITVASVAQLVNSNPTNIVFSVSANTLHLSWPADHRGWTLETNSVGLAATNAWYPYPGSTSLTNVDIPISSIQTNVFFRMEY